MWIKEVFCLLLGAASSLVVAGGLFALITSVGILPRLAGKSHTGSHIGKYEMSVALGGSLGNAFMFFDWKLPLGVVGIGLTGLFMGVFIGCLATALAESLNTTAVFSRRVKLRKGMGIIVLSLALGKTFGSLLFFAKQWYHMP